MSSSDPRLERLCKWLAATYGDAAFTMAPASADASFRRYFRVTRGGDTAIVMDAPPDKEDTGRFQRIAAMLVGIGVNAPRVLARNDGEGFLLLSDLGSRTYLAALVDDRERADRFYGDALQTLIAIQKGGARHLGELPPYDHALLMREMELFPEWFLGRHLGLLCDAREEGMLDDVFELLAEEALTQPRVFVHRDYHSRNLMVCDGGRDGPNPGVLDFQDAVAGPLTYDLVSLLRDCYIDWPAAQVRGWAADFRNEAIAAGLDVGDDEQEFERWFDWMGIQRHLKAIGIFARLWHRDGKLGYLADIPRTLGYVLEVVAHYPRLGPFGEFLKGRVTPALLARAAHDPRIEAR